MAGSGIEVWRGGGNAWQCDQMGHLNVRFYVAHAAEAVVGLAHALGMTGAFSPRGSATLAVREHHIRFLKEARVGDPLHMTCGLLGIEDASARALFVLVHSGKDAPAAVFQTRLDHVASADARRFPWSHSALKRADALAVVIPEGLGPRSLDPGAPIALPRLAEAEAAGLFAYGAGAFGPEHCDVFGRVAAHQLMARLGDGAPHGIAAIRDAAGEHMGLAVVEYRLTYLDHPRAGDRFVVRTGLVRAAPRRLEWAYWMFDPASGAPLAAARAVMVPFDLEARKATTLPDEVVTKLRAKLVEF